MVFIIIGAAALLFGVLERVPVLRFRESNLFRPYFLTDLFYLLTGFVAGSSLAIAYIALGSRWIEAHSGLPRIAHIDLPFWLSIPAALVALDLGNYIAHYLLHRSDLLWEFHKIHHSSLLLDWVATFRSHILEQVFRRLIAPLSIIILGFPIDAVVVAGGLFTAWAMFNHSNLKLDLRFLERVLITPRLHRLHHVSDSSDKNLGTVFTFWDRVRGSYTFIGADPDGELGNGEPAYPQTWASQLFEPILRILKPQKAEEITKVIKYH
jgi:sterol desaturase/sphingolipid hydroxylase (fatty acid hydroxylase superfamily)